MITLGTLGIALAVGVWMVIVAISGMKDYYDQRHPKAVREPESKVIGATDEIGSIDK